jgi:hypothetical protein
MTIWECSFRKKGIDREGALDSLAQRASTFLFSDERFLSLPRRARNAAR